MLYQSENSGTIQLPTGCSHGVDLAAPESPYFTNRLISSIQREKKNFGNDSPYAHRDSRFDLEFSRVRLLAPKSNY